MGVCANCGREVDGTMRFCPGCGTELPAEKKPGCPKVRVRPALPEKRGIRKAAVRPVRIPVHRMGPNGKPGAKPALPPDKTAGKHPRPAGEFRHFGEKDKSDSE